MDKSGAKLTRRTLKEFTSDYTRTLFKVVYPPNVKCLPPEVVVAKAKTHMQKQDIPEYNLVINNCEHFATYCKTGEADSRQLVDKINKTIEDASNKIKSAPIVQVVDKAVDKVVGAAVNKAVNHLTVFNLKI